MPSKVSFSPPGQARESVGRRRELGRAREKEIKTDRKLRFQQNSFSPSSVLSARTTTRERSAVFFRLLRLHYQTQKSSSPHHSAWFCHRGGRGAWAELEKNDQREAGSSGTHQENFLEGVQTIPRTLLSVLVFGEGGEKAFKRFLQTRCLDTEGETANSLFPVSLCFFLPCPAPLIRRPSCFRTENEAKREKKT